MVTALLLFQNTLLCFSVNGVFKEGEHLGSPVLEAVLAPARLSRSLSYLLFPDLLLFCPQAIFIGPILSSCLFCLG